MPYHYPDRNTYYRAQRAEQARINRVNAGIQRYKNSLNASNSDFTHSKPSDFNKYAKVVKYGAYGVGYHFASVSLVWFMLMVCSVFAFANNVNEVFTFETLLSAIRDVPSIHLADYRISDDLVIMVDNFYTNLARSIYEFANVVVSHELFSFLAEPAIELIGAILNAQSFVVGLVETITMPLDFVIYIVASMYQLYLFISYLIGWFFVFPVLPV